MIKDKIITITVPQINKNIDGQLYLHYVLIQNIYVGGFDRRYERDL